MLGFMPAPWEPMDSLAVGRLLAWRLAENHQAELVRAALAAKFGDRGGAVADAAAIPPTAPAILDGPRPPAIPPTHCDGGHAANRDRGRPAAVAAGAKDAGRSGVAVGVGARRANSNNWVLAESPHESRPADARQRSAPADRVPVGVVRDAPGRRRSSMSIGVTIPGVPFVVLGHNARIAWGMTNTGADVQDLAIERIDVGTQAVVLPRRMGADRDRQGRHSRARAQPAAAVRGVEDAQRAHLRRGRPATGTRRRRGCRPTIGPRKSGAPIRCAGTSTGDLATAFEAINRATDWASFTAAVERVSRRRR